MFNPYDKEILKVYGPYVRTYRGCRPRRTVIIRFTDRTQTSTAYARWLMCQHLQRKLNDSEQVDHIDDDCFNDELDNLQLLTRSENIKKHNIGKPSPLKGVERGWRHGTMYGWLRKKCVCELCGDARAAHNKKRNASRRKKK